MQALMQTPAVCGGSKDTRRAVPVCHVLHPMGMVLALGQLVVVQVPVSLGRPSSLQLSLEHATADTAAVSAHLIPVPVAHAGAQASHTYVACWDRDCTQPLLKVFAAQLQVTIGSQLKEVGPSQGEAYDLEWTSCG